MRPNSKAPKTFSIFVKTPSKEGFIRFVSKQLSDGEIIYNLTLEKNIKNSSKFVNFDNVKKQAAKYSELYGFKDVRVVDDKLMKYYYVKKENAKTNN